VGKNAEAVKVRAARAGDGPAIQAFISGLSLRSRYYRFFFPLNSLSDDMLARFTHAYPDTEVTLLACVDEGGGQRVIGMANYAVETGTGQAEYAIVVADDWQRQGIGSRLLKQLTCIASSAGLEGLYGDILSENAAMLGMLRKFGFAAERHPDGGYLRRSSKSLEIYPWRCKEWATIQAAE
jgi:acetyltransferase